jgi:phytoene synthase
MAAAAAMLARPTARTTNFYYSFLFLPKPKRDAIEAVYAFARLGDDAADAHRDSAQAAAALENYRGVLDACYNSTPEAEIGDAPPGLAKAIRRYAIPRRYFDDLIRGLEMDLRMDRGEWAVETAADLEDYCYCVAGAIGLICIQIFGFRNAQTRDYAIKLGAALQMVNVLRDLQADAQRGRLYLPRQEMERFGVSLQQLAEGRLDDAMRRLLRFQAERARGFFGEAHRLLAAEDRRAMIAAEIMGAIYWRLLRTIERSGYNVFGRRLRLCRARKLATALGVYCGARAYA